jgi:hypothetical protein
MKKIIFACAIAVGSMGLYSCGGNNGVTNEEGDGTVIDTDTTVSEIEVEKTTRDIDTTIDTETETIDTDTTNN